MTQSPEFVIKTFLSEFEPIVHKFVVLQETAVTASESTKAFVWHPGVYVWVKDNQVIKVGRHLENARKRALEHIRDNTRLGDLQMVNFENDPEAILLPFNVVNPKDFHWVAALEMFMETTLTPAIPGKRMG